MATPANTTSTPTAPKLPKRFLVNARHADIEKIVVDKADFVITLKSGKKLVIQEGAAYAKKDSSTTFLFLDDEEITANTFLETAQTSTLPWSQATDDSLMQAKVPVLDASSEDLGAGLSSSTKLLGIALALSLIHI